MYNGHRITQQLAVDMHRDWLLYSDEGRKLLEDIAELRGEDLVCWCAPLPCHADVLLELANEVSLGEECLELGAGTERG